jgi:hypothetical protein
LTPAVADRGALDLSPGRSLRTRVAGLFLCLPLLVRLHFDELARQADYPGSDMVPAAAALLSLLTLKLLDKERRSHISDFDCDEALGLFAGLNIPPRSRSPPAPRIAPAAPAGGDCWRAGSGAWRRCCSRPPPPPRSTSTPSRSAAIPPGWIGIICRCAAAPAPAC